MQGVARRLSTALTTAIAEQGSYIGFTSAPLVGPKYDECIQAIRAGIQEAGGDPTDLAEIDIYDANKIASWCCQHPSVALWLNELKSGLALRGFQTVDRWGTHPEYSALQLVPDSAARFALRSAARVVAPGERQVAKTHSLNFSQAKERILDHLTEPGRCVRLTGPSGVGKTRIAYEVLRDTSTIAKAVSVASAVYCDYRSLGQQQLLQVADALVQERTPVLMVVDECPRDVSGMLGDIAAREGSQLRIVTIDIDERPIEVAPWLNIGLNPSDEALTEVIIRQRLPRTVDFQTVDYIKGLCGGFPRIAVLATANFANQEPVLNSIEDVIERILVGCDLRHQDERRAIECLSLFEKLAADDNLSEQWDLVAERLAGLTGDRMYEYIAEPSRHHIVDRRGRYLLVQPTPIAAHLGARRIDLLRVSRLMDFINTAPPDLQIAFLSSGAISIPLRMLPSLPSAFSPVMVLWEPWMRSIRRQEQNCLTPSPTSSPTWQRTRFAAC